MVPNRSLFFTMPANSDSHISYNFTGVSVRMPNLEPVTLSKQKYLLALFQIQKLRKAIYLLDKVSDVNRN